MICPVELELEVEEEEYELSVSDDVQFDLDIGSEVNVTLITGEVYDGEYNIVPSAEAQVFPTANKRMERDLFVAPIPSNYGLITWDGSTLTVS